MPTWTWLTLLLDGVLFEDAEQVEIALSRIRRLVNFGELRESPLQSIAALEEIVQALLTHHPQLAKVPTTRDSSLPLHYAVSMNSLNIVHRLLHRYREGVSVQNAKGKTPLHFCARDGKLDVVRHILLIAPETASIRAEGGKLPLHLACREGHVDICRELLRVHPQGASWQTDKCKVPLHFAARWGHMEIARELLRVYPEGVSILDYEGSLPLHDATRQGQTSMVKYLVPLYPEGLKRENIRGETPLFTAVRSGNRELSSFLIRAFPEGGKHVLQCVRFDDQVGSWEPDLLNMCLYGAVEKGREEACAVKSHRQYSNTNFAIQASNKRPASVCCYKVSKRRHLESHNNSGNDQQQQQLSSSCSSTSHHKVTFLPLHAALQCGASPPVLSHILAKGTNQLMERNTMGMLPLHVAAMFACQDEPTLPIVINLIWKRYEQASSVRDNLGRLPLHLALYSRADCRLVECLLQCSSCSSGIEEDPDNRIICHHEQQRRQRTSIVDEYPLLIATEHGCDLSTVFLLLREKPSVLKNACPI